MNGFWSLTMYDDTSQSLHVESAETLCNQDRQLRGLYLQADSPGKAKEETGCLRRRLNSFPAYIIAGSGNLPAIAVVR